MRLLSFKKNEQNKKMQKKKRKGKEKNGKMRRKVDMFILRRQVIILILSTKKFM